MRTYIVSLLFFLFPVVLTAQDFPEIRIRISSSQYAALTESKGQKMTLKEPSFSIQGQAAKVKEIHSRGNNSLTFPRKSLAVDLHDPVVLKLKEGEVKLKKFDLLNLVMDRNLWHNRWAFLQMKSLGIFPLANSFCALFINDEPQGIYLLVEKPGVITDRLGSPYMLRRGVNHAIDDEYIPTSSKERAKAYKQQYQEIYQIAGKKKGNELADQLGQRLMLQKYFRWLAFNYLIMNGDYADEVFFYIPQGASTFEVLPWDYDDILRPTPHEGAQARNAVPEFKSKLIFSSEDPLDRAIALDPTVYALYVKELKNVLEQLTPEVISSVSTQVKAELAELNKVPGLSDASMFLGKEKFVFSQAEGDMAVALDFILKRRDGLLANLSR